MIVPGIALIHRSNGNSLSLAALVIIVVFVVVLGLARVLGSVAHVTFRLRLAQEE